LIGGTRAITPSSKGRKRLAMKPDGQDPATRSKAPVLLQHGLPDDGKLIAFVVGIEDYQPKSKIPSVEFARNDAKEIAEALTAIYGPDRSDVQLLVDDDATMGNIGYQLMQTIGGLEANDLFVFYYAGHGYHGAGGNRITAWDSHAHGTAETTLLLQEHLIAPLAKSPCTRALAFVDACGAPLSSLSARDVIAEMDPAELKAFLGAANYSALFLACAPGQKSYPAGALKHGIWTHFLLAALRGEDETALAAGRNLTDVSLRDYLRTAVPRYITKYTTIKGQQMPTAHVSATNTFLIRHVPEPEPEIEVDPEGDLTGVGIVVKAEYFERVETGEVKRLPGWKKTNVIFDNVSERTNSFVVGHLESQVDEEIQELYNATKQAFRFRRKAIDQESEGGQGRLDTDLFRFQIETRQNPEDPSEYTITKRLELREGAEGRIEELDDLFGAIFERIVVETQRLKLSFDDVVEKFEDIQEAYGGELKEDQASQQVTFTFAGGPTVCVDLANHRLVVLAPAGRQAPSGLLKAARKIHIGSSSPEQRLLK